MNAFVGRVMCNFRMRCAVKDKRLHEFLTPKFKFGCHIYTLSNTYYKALNNPNISLNPNKITDISNTTIITEDGTKKELDVSSFH